MSFLDGFKKKPIQMFTEEQVQQRIQEVLNAREAAEDFDFSALWDETAPDSGLLAKLMPILAGVISFVTLLVVIFK